MKKTYKAKSLAGAQRRVRELTLQVSECKRIAGILAKLSAKGPAFFNPLEAMAAEKIRDEILSRMGLNPDGTLKASAK